MEKIFAVPNPEAQINLAVLTRLNCKAACEPLSIPVKIALYFNTQAYKGLQGNPSGFWQTNPAWFVWKLNPWKAEPATQVHRGPGKNQEDVLSDTRVPSCRAQETDFFFSWRNIITSVGKAPKSTHETLLTATVAKL